MNPNGLFQRVFITPASVSGVKSAFWLLSALLLFLSVSSALSAGFSPFDLRSATGPAQKTIVLFDRGQEDLVLQLRYEGPQQNFGWLIPVPASPEVRQCRMDCFYDLSQLTQEPLWAQEFNESAMFSSLPTSSIKRVEIPTTGAFEVSILDSKSLNALSDWLNFHHLVLPKEKHVLMENYLKSGWKVVVVWVNPLEKGFVLHTNELRGLPPARSRGNSRITVELSPLLISFASDKCIYPILTSTQEGGDFDLALFAISAEPLLSRVIFEKNFVPYREELNEWMRERPARRETSYTRTSGPPKVIELKGPGQPGAGPFDDPSDPRPSPEVLLRLQFPSSTAAALPETDEEFCGGGYLATARQAGNRDLPECARELPRLAAGSWWVTKQAASFSGRQTGRLELEPAMDVFAVRLRTPEGQTLMRQLPQFGPHAVPLVLASLESFDPHERRLAASALTQMADPGLVAPVAGLLQDPDSRIRAAACSAAVTSWDRTFAPRLVELLSDPDPRVSSAAAGCLQAHPAESAAYVADFRKIAERGGPEAVSAIHLLWSHGIHLPKGSLIPMLASGDYCMVNTALFDLGDRRLELDDISPLLTNSLPAARLQGLVALLRIGSPAAMDRIVPMVRDPDEGLSWVVRNNLRRLSGKKLGADPAAWEKWWSENRKTFSSASPRR